MVILPKFLGSSGSFCHSRSIWLVAQSYSLVSRIMVSGLEAGLILFPGFSLDFVWRLVVLLFPCFLRLFFVHVVLG